MYFSPVIYKNFLSSEMAILANLVRTCPLLFSFSSPLLLSHPLTHPPAQAVGLVNYLSTFLSLYLVDKAGRRVLLVMGGLGMSVFTGT